MVSQPDDSIHQELAYLEHFVDRRPTWAPVVLVRLGELGEEGRADLPRLLAERTVKARHIAARRRAQLASRAAAMAVLVAGAPALVAPAAAANLPAIGTSHQADRSPEMLEVRVTDSQTGQPLSGVTLMTAGEELVGVTDANGAVTVQARFAAEPVISLEREGYPMVLVEGSKLTGRSMIAMRHFSAGIDQAQTTGPMAALAALARGSHPNNMMASKPLGYAGEPETPKAAAKPQAPVVAAKPAPKAPAAPKAPVVAAKPEAPKAPVIAAMPEAPKAPVVVPEAPKAPVVAAKPEAPKAPVVAAKPEAPKAPVIAAKPEAPKAPVIAAKPETPVVVAKPEAPKAPVIAANPAAPEVAPFATTHTSSEPIKPFTTASQPAEAFAKVPVAARTADLPEDQTAERGQPAVVAAAAGLAKAPVASLPAGTPIVDNLPPVASKPVVNIKLPTARSPRASQRIRNAELAAAPPAAATVAIAPENLRLPATAMLPPAAVAQEPAPGWVVVALPQRPRPVAVAAAQPQPGTAMAKITLPSRPRAPQMASVPHVGAALAKPAAATYRVKAGDTLSDIALRELGSSTLWHVVYDANRDQLTNPRWLEVGLTLKIPRGSDAGGQIYVVKQGDSLSKIARVMLGDMKKWRDLYAANKQQIKDPWFIFPGQRLVLPGTQNLAKGPVDERWATLRATVYPPA